MSLSAVAPTVLLDEIEAAEAEGNDDRIEGVLCGAVKQLKMNRAKPDITLYLSLMYLAKIKPNIFATEGVIEVGARLDCLGSKISPPQSSVKMQNKTGSEPFFFSSQIVLLGWASDLGKPQVPPGGPVEARCLLQTGP